MATVTSLMWRSLNTFSRGFALLPPCPIEWDISKKRFIPYTNPKSLFFWKVLMLCLFLSNIVYVILFLAAMLGTATMTLVEVMISCLFLSIGVFANLGEIVIFMHVGNMAQSFNCVAILEKQIKFPTSCSTSQKAGKIDMVGLVLNSITFLFVIHTIIVPICGIYIGLDPYSLFVARVVPLHWQTVAKYGIIPLKIIQIGSWYLVARVLAMTMCTCTLAAYLTLSCIESLCDKSGLIETTKISPYLVEYSSCELILSISYPFLAPAVALCLLNGFVLSILYNFISLKMHHMIPMPFFAVFPTLAVAAITIIQTMVPIAISIHTDTTELRNIWKRFVASSQNKRHVVRQIRAKRSICVYVGVVDHNFFIFCKSLLPTYYEATVYYTITALMSIDTSGMQITV
ncbi:hypothetical protein Fcan01_17210 [Folsomia candida]|uniref:Uncharacterized protein n=1 Tax=Folsomia candida TaxID=158441 RepID=A0A226DRT9_FOLCA|nr:hypothetical protein Fcan01_17210 [Folsomia candida]